MARGGGTGSRNKKKKATEVRMIDIYRNVDKSSDLYSMQATAQQNGVDTNQKIPSDSAGDKMKNIKHRKQKVNTLRKKEIVFHCHLCQEETPPVVTQQPEDDQPQKESQNKLVPTSEQLRLAQITQSADTNKDPQRKAKINQIMEITGGYIETYSN